METKTASKTETMVVAAPTAVAALLLDLRDELSKVPSTPDGDFGFPRSFEGLLTAAELRTSQSGNTNCFTTWSGAIDVLAILSPSKLKYIFDKSKLPYQFVEGMKVITGRGKNSDRFVLPA